MQVDHIKAGAWVFPGGHVDTEPPADAVLREAHEELDIVARFHPAFGARARPDRPADWRDLSR
jgi:8-oxo-dGTP pyrophosphatase MutT (NUDIX family)